MSDAFAPDVGQHVDPAGRVTYDFAGHVHARGLDLDASTVSTPPIDERVRWIEASGLLAGYIAGLDAAGYEALRLVGGDDAVQVLATLDLVAASIAPGRTAPYIEAVVSDDVTVVDRILIDLAGRSSFLQLNGAAAERVVNFGRASVHYSGANVSDVTTIAHGLVDHNGDGLVPRLVLLTGEDSGSAVLAYSVYVTDDTNFTLRGRDVQGLARGPGNFVVNWLAIG